MATNKVVTKIVAIDAASSVFKSLGNVIRSNTLQANLMAKAVTSSVNLASQAVSKLTSNLKDALSVQSDMIGTAGDVMSLTGKTYKESLKYVDQFSEKMERLAATLPGEGKDYTYVGRGIMDNLLPAYRDQYGVIDQKAYDKALESITKNATLRAQINDVDPKLTRLGVSRALGGASFSELERLKYFGDNPSVYNQIETESQKLGIKFDDASSRQRAEILEKALIVPEEAIKDFQKSAKGLISSAKDVLFAPRTGIFGFFRDLDKVTEGNQSVVTSFTETLRQIIGPDGFFAKANAVLKSLGINIDPMKELKSGIDFFNNKIDGVNKYIADINKKLEGKSDKEKQSVIFNEFNKLKDSVVLWFIKTTISLKDWLFNSIQNLSSWFSKNIDVNQIGENLGNIFNSIVDYASKIDWINVFTTIGNVLAKIFNELGDFINRIDFTKLLTVIGQIFRGLFIGLGNFLAALDWKSVGYAALSILAGLTLVAVGVLTASIVASLGALGVAAVAAFIGITAVFAAKAKEIEKAIIDGFEWVGNGIANAFQELSKKSPADLAKMVGKAIWDLGVELQKAITGIGGIWPFNKQDNKPVANKASGNVPTTGILAAAVRESRQMPSGSNLIVANDSEMILNRAQQARLASNLQSTRGGISFSVGHISVQTQATDAKGIAEDVIKEIERSFNQFAQSRLAPTYAT